MVNLDEKRYVALIGLSGCGKTTFSRMLSERLHMQRVDTDDLIRVMGEIFNGGFEEIGAGIYRV